MPSDYDLLLRDARLLTAHADRQVDLAIAHGHIARIWPAGQGGGAAETLDLGGLALLPGLIDGHVHFREPGEHSRKGTFASESRAAAAGGVTTVLTMPNTAPFMGTRDILAAGRECARQSLVDYGFHFGVTGDNGDELRAVRNVPAFKLYMNETTGISSPLCDEAVLREVFAIGHPLSVHAEADTLDFVLDVHRRWGVGPLYVVHVALAREVAALRAAKAAGQWVYGEATPHHLFLTAADFQRLGAYADMRPTLKTAADVAALWQGLADGTIDTVATDHAPHLASEKEQTPPPPGVLGLQTMLPLLLDAAAQGRLTLHDVVRLTSLNPSHIFALAGKGEVRVGADADLVAVDLAARHTVSDAEQLSEPHRTPFAGRSLQGEVVHTWSRGRLICRDGEVVGLGGGAEVVSRDPGRWTA